jgi:hypothetical protein
MKKRYRPVLEPYEGPRMQEDPNGEWCRYGADGWCYDLGLAPTYNEANPFIITELAVCDGNARTAGERDHSRRIVDAHRSPANVWLMPDYSAVTGHIYAWRHPQEAPPLPLE